MGSITVCYESACMNISLAKGFSRLLSKWYVASLTWTPARLGKVLRSAGQCWDCCSSAEFQKPPVGGGHPVSERIHLVALKRSGWGGGEITYIVSSTVCSTFYSVFAKGCFFGWREQGIRTHSFLGLLFSGRRHSNVPHANGKARRSCFVIVLTYPKLLQLYGTHFGVSRR